MTDSESEKSSKCIVYVGPEKPVRRVVYFGIVILPVGSVELSEESDTEDERHVLGKVQLRAGSHVKGIFGAFRLVRFVTHEAFISVSRALLLLNSLSYVFELTRW
jgi:hypothetical protein